MNGTEARPEGRHWTVFLFSTLVPAGMAVALGQDAGFDLLNYHYYAGFSFLHKPFGYDFAPAQIQSFHNPLLHAFSYLALAFLPAKAAAALLGAIQGLNLYLVFQISQILFCDLKKSRRYILGICSACAGFYGIVFTELGATYGDSLVSIPVLAGLLLIIRRLRTGEISSTRASLAFAAAGFLFGAASGLKFTCAIYALGLAFSLPLSLFRRGNWIRVAAALGCGLILGFLAAYGFWGAGLYSAYGNPLFPYLNTIFRSPYFDASNFLDDRFFPKSLMQTLFYPLFFVRRNHLVSETEFRDIRLALCYAAIALVAAISLGRLIRRKRNPSAPAPERQDTSCLLFFILFFLISYITWLHLSSIYRYLIALELIAPVFLALAIRQLFKKDSAVFWLSIALDLVIVVSASPINFGRQEFDNSLLKVQTPGVTGLDRSLVLMTGYEPISYVIPSFPERTRFVRISSTLVTPGRNRFIDRTIKNVLASYDRQHVFAFVESAEEMGLARLDASAYGMKIDARSCVEISSRGRVRGYLCRLAASEGQTGQESRPDLRYSPIFAKVDDVSLTGWANGKFINGRITGLGAGSVDILYELDGEVMPPIRRWPLDSSTLLRIGPLSRTGMYRIIGIRDSNRPEPDVWFPIKVELRIK